LVVTAPRWLPKREEGNWTTAHSRSVRRLM